MNDGLPPARITARELKDRLVLLDRRDGAVRTSAYEQVQQLLGTAICGRALEPGTILTLEDLEVATGASRSVAREAARVLGSMGLLSARKKVGLQVLPDSAWNYFDPQVIRWRLLAPDREEQVRSLRELRMAVEPEAARLASERCSPELAGQIVSAAGAMWAAGVNREPFDFARNDEHFHHLVLQASGNTMFTKLSSVIQKSLHERNLQWLRDNPVSFDDVQLHMDLAGFIQRREGLQASEVAREIIRRTQ